MGPGDTCSSPVRRSLVFGLSMTKPAGTPSTLIGSFAGRIALKSRMKAPSLTYPTSPISTSPNGSAGSGCQRGRPYPRPTSCSAYMTAAQEVDMLQMEHGRERRNSAEFSFPLRCIYVTARAGTAILLTFCQFFCLPTGPHGARAHSSRLGSILGTAYLGTLSFEFRTEGRDLRYGNSRHSPGESTVPLWEVRDL